MTWPLKLEISACESLLIHFSLSEFFFYNMSIFHKVVDLCSVSYIICIVSDLVSMSVTYAVHFTHCSENFI